MTDLPVLCGLVLSGGKSSRMGFDKSTIMYHGAPQVAYMYHLLGTFCKEVFISRKSAEQATDNLPVLTDQYDLDSPLNGILSAFHSRADCAWLTAPVDMPGIDQKILRFLIESRDPECVATCFYDSEGKLPEPLVAIWEPQASALLLEFFAAGNKSPREFLVTHHVRIITAPTCDFHTNINDPEELGRFTGKLPRI